MIKRPRKRLYYVANNQRRESSFQHTPPFSLIIQCSIQCYLNGPHRPSFLLSIICYRLFPKTSKTQTQSIKFAGEFKLDQNFLNFTRWIQFGNSVQENATLSQSSSITSKKFIYPRGNAAKRGGEWGGGCLWLGVMPGHKGKGMKALYKGWGEEVKTCPKYCYKT